MRKNRLLLMMSFAALMVALGTVVFAPFVASNGLRIWLHWQAHRQQLKIELGKTSAPLRSVEIILRARGRRVSIGALCNHCSLLISTSLISI